jgi:hypothetical protein
LYDDSATKHAAQLCSDIAARLSTVTTTDENTSSGEEELVRNGANDSKIYSFDRVNEDTHAQTANKPSAQRAKGQQSSVRSASPAPPTKQRKIRRETGAAKNETPSKEKKSKKSFPIATAPIGSSLTSKQLLLIAAAAIAVIIIYCK